MELKPCPFCGGTARFNETEDGGNFIECAGCGSSTNLRYSLMDDAKPILAESWNRRAPVAAAAPNSVAAVLEGYAESYEQMGRTGNGKVDCISVATDIRQNMIPAAAAPGADQWKEAVIEQCIVAEIGWDEVDPRKSLQQLITWETQVALDPLVSSEAQALIDRGRNEAATAAKDAARYRWLRDQHIGDDPDGINLEPGSKPGLDAAIDAALDIE